MSKKKKNLKGFANGTRNGTRNVTGVQGGKRKLYNDYLKNNDKKLARLDVRCGCRCPYHIVYPQPRTWDFSNLNVTKVICIQ